MLEPSLLHETSELLSVNFSADELDRIGGMIIPGYSCHFIAGENNHITFSSGRAASVLVEYCNTRKRTFDLIKLMIELDESSINGKSVELQGLESYMNKLSRSGVIYDFRKRKLHYSKKEVNYLVNWGSLKDDRSYYFSVLSLDITGNSNLVRKYGASKMEKVYFQLREFLMQKISEYDGRIWNFAGDGGIIAFTFKGHEYRSALCALDIQSSMSVFNMRPELPIKDPIILRIGIDCGRFKFNSDTGHIVSDTINYAAHLEKLGTEPGQISISGRVRKELSIKISRIFSEKFEFEGSSSHRSQL
ncbi:MAG: adenylate/guanylate cyclase domain-containing protein [Spirochaetales bacterium]|nr:adenylate/guanylate cyclase domain-containing protein [Spirochaetales bacterium]